MQLHPAAVVGVRRPIRATPTRLARLVAATCAILLGMQFDASSASAATGRGPTGAALVTVLADASHDLLMPSETDAPFTPFVWRGEARAKLTGPRLLTLTGHAPGTPVEVVDLAYFFRNVAQPQPWHDETQARNVRKFRKLVAVLQRHLTDIHVYRVGTIQIDVYIVGKAGSDLAGLATLVVET